MGNVRFTSPYKEYSDASLNPPTQTHLHTSSTISRPSHVSSSATSSPQSPPHIFLPSTNLAFHEPPTAAAPNSLPPQRQIRSQAQSFAVVDTMPGYLHQVRGGMLPLHMIIHIRCMQFHFSCKKTQICCQMCCLT